MINLPIPTPAMDLRDVCRAVAAYRATDPAYDDPRGVALEEEWTRSLRAFFDAGGTREAADAIEDDAFSPFACHHDPLRITDSGECCDCGAFPAPAATDQLTFDECEAAGVDGTGRFVPLFGPRPAGPIARRLETLALRIDAGTITPEMAAWHLAHLAHLIRIGETR